MQALESLFTKALKLEQPWMITKVEFDEVGGAIRVFIDFPRGSMFSCPRLPVHRATESLFRVSRGEKTPRLRNRELLSRVDSNGRICRLGYHN
jgi:hypothetical protein